MSRGADDRGVLSTELAIVTPIAIVLLCLVAFVGRTSIAHQQVVEAARDSARAASIERDQASAERAARAGALQSLASGGFRCQSEEVTIDVSSFGPGGSVTATVRCEIRLSDLGLIGLGGTRSVEASSVAVVDRYRATS